MKYLKRILSVFAALVLSLMMSGLTAFAAGGTITVTPPAGTTGSTTYSLYKVFVAVGNGTGIRYNTVNVGDEITENGETLLHSKGWKVPDVAPYVTGYDATTTPHFIVDDTGNVHWGTIVTGAQGTTGAGTSQPHPEQVAYAESDIIDAQTAEGEELTLPDYAVQAIRAYIEAAGDKPIQTVTTTGTTPATFTDVDNGYYYVSTTTGSTVSVTSANPNASVTDKNLMPTLEKIITGVTKTGSATAGVGSVESGGKRAIAEYGATVTYQVTVKLNTGATNVILHDKLDDGLLRLVDADPTIAYQNNGTVVETGGQAVIYRNADGITGTSDDPAGDDTLTIDFTGTNADIDTAVVTYSAVVESATLSQSPAENTAYLTYGTNTPKAETEKVHTSVYNAKYTVTKMDNANQPLAGAGFLLRKTETVGSTTNTYYYKYDEGTKSVSWVQVTPEGSQTPELAAKEAAEAGTITQLTTTAAEGGNVVAFTGLADGSYELYELTVPTGYMRATDTAFTIKPADTVAAEGESDAFSAANLEQTTEVKNRPGSSLPSTGGEGSVLTYVIGGTVFAAAAILLILRRRRA